MDLFGYQIIKTPPYLKYLKIFPIEGKVERGYPLKSPLLSSYLNEVKKINSEGNYKNSF